MIGEAIVLTVIVVVACALFALGMASVYFWHDERKRRASHARTEATQRAVYAWREACTYEAAAKTQNIRKGHPHV